MAAYGNKNNYRGGVGKWPELRIRVPDEVADALNDVDWRNKNQQALRVLAHWKEDSSEAVEVPWLSNATGTTLRFRVPPELKKALAAVPHSWHTGNEQAIRILRYWHQCELAPPTIKKCKGRTATGSRCKRITAAQHEYCYMHGLQEGSPK